MPRRSKKNRRQGRKSDPSHPAAKFLPAVPRQWAAEDLILRNYEQKLDIGYDASPLDLSVVFGVAGYSIVEVGTPQNYFGYSSPYYVNVIRNALDYYSLVEVTEMRVRWVPTQFYTSSSTMCITRVQYAFTPGFAEATSGLDGIAGCTTIQATDGFEFGWKPSAIARQRGVPTVMTAGFYKAAGGDYLLPSRLCVYLPKPQVTTVTGLAIGQFYVTFTVKLSNRSAAG